MESLPGAPTRNHGLSARRRAQITNAARKVISQRGVESTRIIDVADEAGVSAGMVQHYFRSREALILATFEQFFEESREHWKGAIKAEPDPLGKLRALLRTIVESQLDPVELYSMWIELHAAGTRNERLGEFAAEGWQDWLADIEEVVEEGTRAGVFAPRGPAKDVAIRMVSLMDGLSIHVARRHFGMTTAEMYRHAATATAIDLSIPVELLIEGQPLES